MTVSCLYNTEKHSIYLGREYIKEVVVWHSMGIILNIIDQSLYKRMSDD